MIMRYVYHTLNLAPAPLFLIGFVWSVIHTHHDWQMPAMWFVMFLAHVTPWILWFKQRHFTRN